MEEVKALLLSPWTWLAICAGSLTGVWWWKLTSSTANLTLVVCVVALGIAVSRQPWILSQPIPIRLLWVTLACAAISLALFYTLWTPLPDKAAVTAENVPPAPALADVLPHLQPELLIDSVGPDAIDFRIRITNISEISVTDVNLSQSSSVLRTPTLPTDALPVTQMLPARGRVSVPGLDAGGLHTLRQLHVVITFSSTINSEAADFLSSYEFALPTGTLTPQTFEPRSIFETTGITQQNVRSAVLDEMRITLTDQFVGLPVGTISFWTGEMWMGKPNLIIMTNYKRMFSYNPVTHTAALSSKPSNETLTISFEPKDRHLIIFGWDEIGPATVCVDGVCVDRQDKSQASKTP